MGKYNKYVQIIFRLCIISTYLLYLIEHFLYLKTFLLNKLTCVQQIHENNRLLQSLGGALWSVWHPLLHYYHIHFIIKVCQWIFNIFTNLLCAVSYECVQRCDWFVIVELNVIRIGWVYSTLIFSYSFSYINDLRYNTNVLKI